MEIKFPVSHLAQEQQTNDIFKTILLYLELFVFSMQFSHNYLSVIIQDTYCVLCTAAENAHAYTVFFFACNSKYFSIFAYCFQIHVAAASLLVMCASSSLACHILECSEGLAQEVISTIGQAFELRFKQYLKNPPKLVTPHDR